jgi:hypothetical protein
VTAERRVVVAGGGPAGLVAAGSAAGLGAPTALFERMPRPGLKLSITGKGRCNVTNIAPLEEFIGHFGPNGLFLRQAFGRFFSEDTVRLLEGLGVPCVAERGGRVFPASQDAGEVTRALARRAAEAGAEIRLRARIRGVRIEGGAVTGVGWSAEAGDGPLRFERADAVVVATGGLSYPGTGCTGDGLEWARSAGLAVTPTRPALVPLVTAGDTARRLQGLSLRNAGLTLRANGKRVVSLFGEMLFTHFGLSGPVVLTASRAAVDALRIGAEVEASIDLKPALSPEVLDARLLRDLREHGTRHAKALAKGLVPLKMIPVCLEAAGLDPDKPCHQVSAAERKRLAAWLKDFRLKVTGSRPLSEAIVTAGGVSLAEVNPRTMESRRVRGLYFCGEVLDLDGDTGGYNLQAALSTGLVAGESAAKGSWPASGPCAPRTRPAATP